MASKPLRFPKQWNRWSPWKRLQWLKERKRKNQKRAGKALQLWWKTQPKEKRQSAARKAAVTRKRKREHREPSTVHHKEYSTGKSFRESYHKAWDGPPVDDFQVLIDAAEAPTSSLFDQAISAWSFAIRAQFDTQSSGETAWISTVFRDSKEQALREGHQYLGAYLDGEGVGGRAGSKAVVEIMEIALIVVRSGEYLYGHKTE